MNRNSIKQVLSQLGAFELKDSGESVMTGCVLAPWTHEGGTDRRPSLGVKEDQGMSVAHCFSCGFRGGMISLVKRYASYAVPEGKINEDQVKQLVDYIFLAEDEEVTVVPDMVEAPKPSEDVLSCIGVWHDYFEERGITKSSFDQWRLGYSKETNRALFPVFDKKEPVGIIGRSVEKKPLIKYMNDPPKFKKSSYLYGLHLCPPDIKNLIVVEGPIDAIKVNQYLEDSIYRCVAIMGSEPSKAQMDLLTENAEEVICMLDNDSSGKKGTIDLAKGLDNKLIVSIVTYPENMNDPDDVGEQVLDMLSDKMYFLQWQVKNILDKGLKVF